MKKYVFILVSLCFIINANAQSYNEVIDSLFRSKEEFVKQIPEKYYFYYEPYLSISSSEIIDSLKKQLKEIKLENSYILEYLPDVSRDKRYFIFWNKLVTVYLIFDKNLNKITTSENTFPTYAFIEKMTDFKEHVENWDEYITNRSYFATPIAGGGYIFCSKIEFGKTDYKIDNAVFREYPKDTPFYYLKELAYDNYKTRMKANIKWFEEQNLIPNPEYLEEQRNEGVVIIE